MNSLDDRMQPGELWIAGYGREIDWIESAAWDMMFWYSFLSARGAQTSRERPTQAAQRALLSVRKRIPKLEKKLGFSLYLGGQSGIALA